MAFKRGRVYWTHVRQQGGTRKRLSLGTTLAPIAREMEAMLTRLASLREWTVLESADRRPDGVGELFDYWRREGETLSTYKDLINDCDLSAFVDAWLKWAERRATERTVAKYLRQLRVLIPEGKCFSRSRFRRREISAALHKLTGSGSTARRYHAAWSSFGNYLVEAELIEHNPLRDIRAPRSNAGREVYLDRAAQIRLVEAQSFPYSALAALREGGGVEVSAALRVRRRDFSELERTVLVRGTKNEWRSRSVIVEEWAWPLLRRAFANKLPDALVFEGLDYETARREHREALKAKELREDYRMHDARHSLAVRWMQKGIGPEIIANNLGHRDASLVLKLYGRYRPRADDLRRVLDRVAL